MRTPRALLLNSAIPAFYPDEAPPIAPAASVGDRMYPAAEAPPAETPAETPPAAPEGDADLSLGGGGEEKPEGEKPPEGEEKPGETPAIEVKLPDGFEAKPEVLESFKTLAAEAGITNEAAQKLVDLYAKEVQDMATAQAQAWTDTISGWKADLEKLPEFATPGKRTEAQTVIGRALDEYATPEAREAFNITGAGWNPHIVQAFYKMAKALSEGGPTLPGLPAGQPTSTAQRLYGNQ